MASGITRGAEREYPSPDGRTAVIITALGVESRAVMEHLDGAAGGRGLREYRGTVYETSTFTGEHGRWLVAVAEAGPGNTGAGVELERAVSAFSPDIALFVGIAGGIKDVALGDVVAADAVYDYETGKETRTGFLPRIKTRSPSHRLVQYARAVARKAHRGRDRKPGGDRTASRGDPGVLRPAVIRSPAGRAGRRGGPAGAACNRGHRVGGGVHGG